MTDRKTKIERMNKFKVLGASLDPLDLPERIALKLAYIRSMKDCSNQELPLDPYDAIKSFLENQNVVCSNVEWIGKFVVESWLSPRPSISSMEFLKKACFTDFLDRNGCLTYSNSLTSYLKNNVHPSKPIMIGVDHSLTGGVIQYISEFQKDLNVLIFDSHTDIIDFRTKSSLFTSSFCKATDTPSYIYECGSFIDYLLSEKVFKPNRIWILGTQEFPKNTQNQEMNPYIQKLERWVRRGVHIISKSDLIKEGVPEEIEGPAYISIDIDVGSYSSVFACRFMDRVGLEYEDIVNILHSLSSKIKGRKIFLLGLDIMEIDVHFLDMEVLGRRDCTLKIVKKIFDELICSTSNEN